MLVQIGSSFARGGWRLRSLYAGVGGMDYIRDSRQVQLWCGGAGGVVAWVI